MSGSGGDNFGVVPGINQHNAMTPSPSFSLCLRSSERTVPVVIQPGLRFSLPSLLADACGGRRPFLITDNNLFDLYINSSSVHAVDTSPFADVITLAPGEPSKTRETIAYIHDRLLEEKAGRDSVIIALGGGVIGDMAGFAAATLHRGIGLVHLPTSLLAQVDSCIGGKTGVNHPLGKNLIGAIYHPDTILVDPEFLITLPDEEYTNGMAEVIKYAISLDKALWSLLVDNSQRLLARDPSILTAVIQRCTELKIGIVAQDERETGLRSILNFGHTVGHAIERLSGYRVKHGFAIAEGMRVALRLSHQLCGYPGEQMHNAEQLLALYGLPHIPLPPFDDMWNALSLDKKARRAEPRFTLLNADSSPALFHPVSREEVRYAIAE